MSATALLIVLLVLASFAGTALMFFAVRTGRKRQEELRAYAEANGWRFAHHASGGLSESVITDPGAGWTLTIHHSSSGGTGSSGTRSSSTWTEYREPTLDIPAGMAVLGPEIPKKTQEMADKMLAMMGGDVGRYLLDKMTGGLGEEVQGLRTVNSEGPGTLFATQGAESVLDDLRFAPELANARVGRNEAQQPIVMRGAFGLRLRVASRLRKVAEVEEFIRLGRALSDNLRSG